MPLFLRVDVDKPFGNANFINAVRSKLSEDYWYPKGKLFSSHYLVELAEFIEHCNKENVSGHFYFRRCTVPNERIANLMQAGGHKAGVHAENTRSFETFSAEWEQLSKRCRLPLDSFSKHGSGKLKLGKHHYPPYEPEKYLDWAKQLGVDFKTGNDLCTSPDDFDGDKSFYPKIFWIEREYRDPQFSSLEELVEAAKTNLVPFLIHPSNYASTKEVKEDFSRLIELAKEHNVGWAV